MTAPELRIACPAKVNLRLEVLARRADGYHELQMANAPLALADELVVRAGAPGVRLVIEGADLAADETNLAYRAARAVMEWSGTGTGTGTGTWNRGTTDGDGDSLNPQSSILNPRGSSILNPLHAGVDLRLTKRIPVAAGLGGGSSDAAAAILAAERALGVTLSDDERLSIATRLGADVPFFLQTHGAIVRGIGEIVIPIEIAREIPVVLLNPRFGVSTAEVYAACADALRLPQEPAALPEPLVIDGAAGAAALLRNDLEAIVAARHPEIEVMKRLLIDAGAVAAMMTGSGPTVFGLFETEPGAEMLAKAQTRGFLAITTSIVPRAPVFVD
ncbi:4-(cytidine 5'-diphospho)-2-C-methyl-D-erythritol kinase [bacterium]|nr:4-(cytidine 5'-diphospho)-2-C-methyl-D-erythritol kinase [bacterium]